MIYFLIYLLIIMPEGMKVYPFCKTAYDSYGIPTKLGVAIFSFLWIFMFWMHLYVKVKKFINNKKTIK